MECLWSRSLIHGRWFQDVSNLFPSLRIWRADFLPRSKAAWLKCYEAAAWLPESSMKGSRNMSVHMYMIRPRSSILRNSRGIAWYYHYCKMISQWLVNNAWSRASSDVSWPSDLKSPAGSIRGQFISWHKQHLGFVIGRSYPHLGLWWGGNATEHPQLHHMITFAEQRRTKRLRWCVMMWLKYQQQYI